MAGFSTGAIRRRMWPSPRFGNAWSRRAWWCRRNARRPIDMAAAVEPHHGVDAVGGELAQPRARPGVDLFDAADLGPSYVTRWRASGLLLPYSAACRGSNWWR